jgi:hypothetical protein
MKSIPETQYDEARKKAVREFNQEFTNVLMDLDLRPVKRCSFGTTKQQSGRSLLKH